MSLKIQILFNISKFEKEVESYEKT